MQKTNDEGFTLIELLIVIVILGILAAVVVFAVGGITDQGQESACKAELKTVEVAIEAYRAQELEYPNDITVMTSYWRNDPTLYNVGTGGTIGVTSAGTAKECVTTYP